MSGTDVFMYLVVYDSFFVDVGRVDVLLFIKKCFEIVVHGALAARY